MPDPQLIYWDACVFIRYIAGDAECIGTLDAIMDAVGRSAGEMLIVTSAISKVEVAYIQDEKDTRMARVEIEERIDELFGDASIIKLIDMHDIIAVDARKLIRDGLQNEWSLKPMDAIHLASAKWAKVYEFHTYDVGLIGRYAGSIGCKIVEPYIAQPPLPMPTSNQKV